VHPSSSLHLRDSSDVSRRTSLAYVVRFPVRANARHPTGERTGTFQRPNGSDGGAYIRTPHTNPAVRGRAGVDRPFCTTIPTASVASSTAWRSFLSMPATTDLRYAPRLRVCARLHGSKGSNRTQRGKTTICLCFNSLHPSVRFPEAAGCISLRSGLVSLRHRSGEEWGCPDAGLEAPGHSERHTNSDSREG
jgi:hypothetical protein